MDQNTTPASSKKGRPPLRRGQLRNRIIRDLFISLASLARPRRANGGGGSGTTTPASNSAYSSESSSDS